MVGERLLACSAALRLIARIDAAMAAIAAAFIISAMVSRHTGAYRGAGPPWPVVLGGADCVVLGPLAVLVVELMLAA
jgi:hypothetical protein